MTFQIAPGHIECRWGERVFDLRHGEVPGHTGHHWILLEDGDRPFDWTGSGPIVERSKQAMFKRIEIEMSEE